MPDPNLIAELTAALRPTWICSHWGDNEPCEGRVVKYVHLFCEGSHFGQGPICAVHLERRACTALPEPTCDLVEGTTCISPMRIRMIIPIDNIGLLLTHQEWADRRAANNRRGNR